MNDQRRRPASLFYSYAPKDEKLRRKLEVHLSSLEREGFISGWYDGLVQPGSNKTQEILNHLNEAFIILLLISPDFLASDDHYNIMQHALGRHEQGEAQVIPIILRPCDWERMPFAELQCLPRNHDPVVTWSNRDEAFRDVVQYIRQVIEQSTAPHTATGTRANATSTLVTLPAVYKAHQHFVLTIAWSPDNKYIASAGADETVRVWNAATLETLQTYSAHRGWLYPSFKLRPYIYVVAWSPDGKWIASAGTGTKVYIWEALSGVTRLVNPHPKPLLDFGSIHALAWSPEGTRIASICSSDVMNMGQKMVRIWNKDSGQELFYYPMPTGLIGNGALTEVSALAWSPNGRYIASSAGDQTIHVWDAIREKQIATWRVRASLVLAIAWSPDSKQIAVATAAGAKSAVFLWSMSEGRTILTYNRHKSDVRTVAWSPDGTCIASGGQDDTVQIWDAGTGDAWKIFRHHASFVTAVAWSPDGTRIASGSHDNTVYIWQAS